MRPYYHCLKNTCITSIATLAKSSTHALALIAIGNSWPAILAVLEPGRTHSGFGASRAQYFLLLDMLNRCAAAGT
jgi:hypothetical protein